MSDDEPELAQIINKSAHLYLNQFQLLCWKKTSSNTGQILSPLVVLAQRRDENGNGGIGIGLVSMTMIFSRKGEESHKHTATTTPLSGLFLDFWQFAGAMGTDEGGQ